MNPEIQTLLELYKSRVNSNTVVERITPFSARDLAVLPVEDQVRINEIIRVDWDTTGNEGNLIKLSQVLQDNPRIERILSLYSGPKARQSIFDLPSINQQTAVVLADTVKGNITVTVPDRERYQKAVSDKTRESAQSHIEAFHSEVRRTVITPPGFLVRSSVRIQPLSAHPPVLAIEGGPPMSEDNIQPEMDNPGETELLPEKEANCDLGAQALSSPDDPQDVLKMFTESTMEPEQAILVKDYIQAQLQGILPPESDKELVESLPQLTHPATVSLQDPARGSTGAKRKKASPLQGGSGGTVYRSEQTHPPDPAVIGKWARCLNEDDWRIPHNYEMLHTLADKSDTRLLASMLIGMSSRQAALYDELTVIKTEQDELRRGISEILGKLSGLEVLLTSRQSITPATAHLNQIATRLDMLVNEVRTSSLKSRPTPVAISVDPIQSSATQNPMISDPPVPRGPVQPRLSSKMTKLDRLRASGKISEIAVSHKSGGVKETTSLIPTLVPDLSDQKAGPSGIPPIPKSMALEEQVKALDIQPAPREGVNHSRSAAYQLLERAGRSPGQIVMQSQTIKLLDVDTLDAIWDKIKGETDEFWIKQQGKILATISTDSETKTGLTPLYHALCFATNMKEVEAVFTLIKAIIQN